MCIKLGNGKTQHITPKQDKNGENKKHTHTQNKNTSRVKMAYSVIESYEGIFKLSAPCRQRFIYAPRRTVQCWFGAMKYNMTKLELHRVYSCCLPTACDCVCNHKHNDAIFQNESRNDEERQRDVDTTTGANHSNSEYNNEQRVGPSTLASRCRCVTFHLH